MQLKGQSALITWEKIFLALFIIFFSAAMYMFGLVILFFDRARHFDPQDERRAKKQIIAVSVLWGLATGSIGAYILVTKPEFTQNVWIYIPGIIVVIVGISIFMWIIMSLAFVVDREWIKRCVWSRDKNR